MWEESGSQDKNTSLKVWVTIVILFILSVIVVLGLLIASWATQNKNTNTFQTSLNTSIKQEEANLANTDANALNANNANNFYLQENGKLTYYLNNPQTILMNTNYPFATEANDTNINLLADFINSNINTNYVYSMIDDYYTALTETNNLINIANNVSSFTFMPKANAVQIYNIGYYNYYPITNFAWYLQDSNVNTTNENTTSINNWDNSTNTNTITRYWTYLAYINGGFTLAPNMDSVSDAILACLTSYLKANNDVLLNSNTRMNAYDISLIGITDAMINVNTGNLSFKITYNNQTSNVISFDLTPQWNAYWGNSNVSYLPYYHYYYNKYGKSISNLGLNQLNTIGTRINFQLSIPSAVLKENN